MDNIDALKIALYYFANRVFNGRKDQRTLNSLLLNNIDDLEYFKSSMQSFILKKVYDSLDNSLNKKLEL